MPQNCTWFNLGYAEWFVGVPYLNKEMDLTIAGSAYIPLSFSSFED